MALPNESSVTESGLSAAFAIGKRSTTKRALLVGTGLFLASTLQAQRAYESAGDTAAARWMRDTVTQDLSNRPELRIGQPRFQADTAWLSASRTEKTAPDRIYEFSVVYRFERRGAVWTLMPTRVFMHGHGVRKP
jgi:hypothetical protein